MKTNVKYIHEYDFLDNMTEAVHMCEQEINKISREYECKRSENQLRSFFESSDDLLYMESENFFSRIGNAILSLITKIANFLRTITDKLFHNTGIIKTDSQKVDKIIANHPDLRDDIINGLNREWFTYKDVAAYEKDVVGLVNMLKKKAIDNATFKDKLAKAGKAFSTSVLTAAPVITAVATIGGFVGPFLEKVTEPKESLEEVKKQLAEESKEIKSKSNNVNESVMYESENDDKSRTTMILQAYTTATSVISKECAARCRVQSAFSNYLSSVVNKYEGGTK